MIRDATISQDGVYRYDLTRIWDPELPMTGWIMLNPSTADHEQDDATIRRCIGFARSRGSGGIIVTNLFALRARNPKRLRDHPDPVGPGNALALRDMLGDEEVRWVFAAWGGTAQDGDEERALKIAAGANRKLWALGFTKDGKPRHPLYLRADAVPALYFGDS